jgi:hypothetical protein
MESAKDGARIDDTSPLNRARDRRILVQRPVSFNPVVVASIRSQNPAQGSCPRAWCNWRRVTAFTGKGRADQLAIAGRLTVGSSLNGAMVSSVM